ncbi:TetR/AcrR family transcriptional regulator [Secundilactobacillus paracollinoides]|uniref:HTH tetR-type domain-containing protein n=2 Tax=Secundilactobacillus paracollinoides TaxID=240427 RepID=A0A1B2IWW3_9LACO|nr:TetR/AcrR family transcriptional regulator [Secundilactobacillus paracollinoides]ANZ60676.1 hypothetical protein AYR61_04520 [Secundilactobacillus paracollinoides]ANZ66519.1 hypothetical protein AYR63_04805 [Secundilactobacillus paracollinoides]
MSKYSDTDTLIIESALHLFETPGAGNITALQVIDAAHIHRSTFYHHFATFNDLVAAMMNRVFPDPLNTDLRLSENIVNLVETIDNNQVLFRHLMQFRGKFEEIVKQRFVLDVNLWTKNVETNPVAVELLYGCVIGMMASWLNNPQIKKKDVLFYFERLADAFQLDITG